MWVLATKGYQTAHDRLKRGQTQNMGIPIWQTANTNITGLGHHQRNRLLPKLNCRADLGNCGQGLQRAALRYWGPRHEALSRRRKTYQTSSGLDRMAGCTLRNDYAT